MSLLGTLARWVCERAGYELVPIRRFERLLAEYVKSRPGLTFVQIGANDGIMFDNLYYFVIEHGCKGLVVEPLPDYFERLALNYRNYPHVVPVRAAVHPTLSHCTLYRVDPALVGKLPSWTAGIASLDPAHCSRVGIADEHVIEETVEALPLMTLLERHQIRELDLLQIDTEGFDAEVIAMIDFSRIRPSIIKYEHVNLSERARTATRALLERNGYECLGDGNDTVAAVRNWQLRPSAAPVTRQSIASVNEARIV